MIDEVYKSVQTILNKNHFGTISPDRFNQMVSIALFQAYGDMFDQFRQAINKKRTGRGGLEFADIQEEIDFYTDSELINTGGGTFTPIEVSRDKVVTVLYDNTAEEIEVAKLDNDSLAYVKGLSAPSLTYPTYQLKGDTIKVLPADILEVEVYYVRTPKKPKWTYVTVGTTPVFDGSAVDYQDLDMPADWTYDVVIKTVELCALHLRELQVNQIESKEDTEQYQKDAL